MKIQGRVAPGFDKVADAFGDNFRDRGELGAACAVYYRGELVVDIWAGLADKDSQRPWGEDTLQLIMSSTKGAIAICINQLLESGQLDLDATVACYWPEFAENGKAAITVKQVLCHQAGLAKIDGEHLTLDEVYQWQPVVNAIARQEVNWAPGSTHGYHARSFGWINGELIRRVSGLSPGQYFARHIAEPLGLDFYIGLPAELEPRVATLYSAPPLEDPAMQSALEQFMGPHTMLGQVMAGPNHLFSYGPMWNSHELRGAEIPSSNGIADARSLARMYAATIGEVDGVRLLQGASVERARQVCASGSDCVLGLDSIWGLGFMLPPMLAQDCSPQAFGHSGAGGSLGIAEPDSGIAMGYVMNQMQLGVSGDPRAGALLQAVHQSL